MLLNILYKWCKYIIKAAKQDLFVDLQAREWALYEGYLLVNPCASYLMHSYYLLAWYSNEWLIDIPTCPSDHTLFSVEIDYWDFTYTGNSDSIEKNFISLLKKLAENVVFENEILFDLGQL